MILFSFRSLPLQQKIGDIKGAEGKKKQSVWKISMRYRFKNEIQMTQIV